MKTEKPDFKVRHDAFTQYVSLHMVNTGQIQ